MTQSLTNLAGREKSEDPVVQVTDEVPTFENASDWAAAQFGACRLGDPRRTARLVYYARRQAERPEATTNAACQGEDAAAEGAYRFLRNKSVEARAIEAGPFCATAEVCAERRVVLAIQDTTGVTYPHAARDSLGDMGGVKGKEARGFWVHSTLMVDAETREPIGLIDQQRWLREMDRPRGNEQKNRPYEEKESYKWERASRAMSERLNSTSNVITVCDREADIYEYLQYQMAAKGRFVVRANHDRSLLHTSEGENLWAWMAGQPVLGERTIRIEQRGAQRAGSGKTYRPAREGREAVVTIQAVTVTLAPPSTAKSEATSLTLNVVYVREVGVNPDDGVEWMLLTTEPVDTREAAERVVEYYETRWLVEEFHQSWKVGCRLEQRRLQTADNLERLMVVLAPVAVRLLRLRSLTQATPTASCESVLDRESWVCLHAVTRPNVELPSEPPSIRWAMISIAKLGGWRDTKRTGRIGWMSLWRGWRTFEDHLIGWRAARRQGFENTVPH